jgi:hypothetical protein
MVNFGDPINWEPYRREIDSLFFKCVIIKNVPDNVLHDYELLKLLTSYHNACEENKTYIVIMHVTHTESADEMYAKLFKHFHATYNTKNLC